LFNGVHADLKPAQDGTLILYEPTSAVQGYYQCIARNSVGMALSNKTRVLQASQAAFEQTSAVARTATVGQKLVLPCQPKATTVPAPRSTFYNRDFDWKYGNDQGSQESVLLGKRIQIDENGTYIERVTV
jgi:hypothetical protein